MNIRVFALVSVICVGGAAQAFPLIPTIRAHDFNFGGYNGTSGPAEWNTNGAAPDTLVYTQEGQHEVTAYWPSWPDPPTLPVFDLANVGFGGDLVLGVKFTGQDAPYLPIDVSLTGTGLYDNAPDLLIFGTTAGFSGLLWALDLDQVSLYGYSDKDPAYVLEGLGTIVGGLIPQQYNLIGHQGAMRGHIDFRLPDVLLPALYDPMVNDTRVPSQWRAAYSGETGVVPEPSMLVAASVALAAIVRRRRNK